MVAWKRILVPTDFSETSAAAIRQGVELARVFKAGLILLYVGDRAASEVATEFPIGLDGAMADAERERLNKILTPQEQREIHPEFVIAAGTPAVEIVRAADEREVDLIVMGTHGRGGVSHLLLGSVAEKVIRTAPCPVLVVRGPVAVEQEVEYSAAEAIGAQMSI